MNDHKVLVLGIDGMDPKMTKRMVDEGKLPNITKFIARGAAREDLYMLGAQPTITPPMWTTLSTGAYPMTHGITCFWNTPGNEIGKFLRTFNSALVKAEQIWEVTAKAGKKTLVWTWPCSWPPVMDNDNLHVAGGTAPTSPNNAGEHIDNEILTYASCEAPQITKLGKIDLKGGAGCIVTDDMLDAMKGEEDYIGRAEKESVLPSAIINATPIFNQMESEECSEFDVSLPRYAVPIVAPKNWAHDIPKGAKELYVIVKDGLMQYPALMLQNEEGYYDTVELYGSKKEKEPFLRLRDGEYYPTVVTLLPFGDKKVRTTRGFSILTIDPEGKSVKIFAGTALDIETERKEAFYYPKSLYAQTVRLGGYEPATTLGGGGYPEMLSRRALPSWEVFQKWQAEVLLGLIKENGYEAVFTHNHSVDHIGHICWRWAKYREKYGNSDETVYQGFLEEIYKQVDDYVGAFMPLLDQGWCIIITSDHGLLCSEEDEIPFLGDGFSMNVGVLRDLGYTVMRKDENGKDIREIDWEHTLAVAPRGNHIYINLKGRNPQGIVEETDKFELERKIIDDLYSYRMNGKRIINMALRNKDAILLGLGGPECGDIIYFLEEGFNRLHGDALSTTEGYFGTSVSPLFIAAGAGIKEGFYTERMIREVDVAPTVAVVMDLDVPAQCEGAPIYQILAK